jgi:hypothetical protein
LILISDANILIDLGFVDGINLLPKLGKCEVLDLVLMECEHPSQPELVRTVKESGIFVIPVSQALLNEASSLQARQLSVQDKLTLCYASHCNGTVLTGDRPLREKCQESDIEYIRPFIQAGILRKNPNINWNKDRGRDVESAPWFHKFEGDRINDHHLSLADKNAVRRIDE